MRNQATEKIWRGSIKIKEQKQKKKKPKPGIVSWYRGLSSNSWYSHQERSRAEYRKRIEEAVKINYIPNTSFFFWNLQIVDGIIDRCQGF